jgi:hypothetical protein
MKEIESAIEFLFRRYMDNNQKLTLVEKIGSCKEKGHKLHMSNTSCIEKRTFLYMTPNEIRK